MLNNSAAAGTDQKGALLPVPNVSTDTTDAPPAAFSPFASTLAVRPSRPRGRSGPKSRFSPYIGVSQYKRTGRWEAHIWDSAGSTRGSPVVGSKSGKGRQLHLGSFSSAEQAAQAYDRAALLLRGPSTALNFSLDDYHDDELLRELSQMSRPDMILALRKTCDGEKEAAALESFRARVPAARLGLLQQRAGQLPSSGQVAVFDLPGAAPASFGLSLISSGQLLSSPSPLPLLAASGVGATPGALTPSFLQQQVLMWHQQHHHQQQQQQIDLAQQLLVSELGPARLGLQPLPVAVCGGTITGGRSSNAEIDAAIDDTGSSSSSSDGGEQLAPTTDSTWWGQQHMYVLQGIGVASPAALFDHGSAAQSLLPPTECSKQPAGLRSGLTPPIARHAPLLPCPGTPPPGQRGHARTSVASCMSTPGCGPPADLDLGLGLELPVNSSPGLSPAPRALDCRLSLDQGGGGSPAGGDGGGGGGGGGDGQGGGGTGGCCPAPLTHHHPQSPLPPLRTASSVIISREQLAQLVPSDGSGDLARTASGLLLSSALLYSQHSLPGLEQLDALLLAAAAGASGVDDNGNAPAAACWAPAPALRPPHGNGAAEPDATRADEGR